MIDFHIIVGIDKIAGHARSLRSLQSLQSPCFDFRMIAGTVVIVAIYYWKTCTSVFHLIVEIADDPS